MRGKGGNEGGIEIEKGNYIYVDFLLQTLDSSELCLKSSDHFQNYLSWEPAPCMANTKKTSYLAIVEVTNSDAGNFGCLAYAYVNDNINIVDNFQIIPGKFLPFFPLRLAILFDIQRIQ